MEYKIITEKMRTRHLIFILLLSIITFITITNSGLATAEPDEAYLGTGYCVDCHPSQSRSWAESAHTNSYSNPEFQKVWGELGEDSECLECHTTGYDATTETYELPEIQCEECHGPGDTMNRDPTPELCGECHSGLYPTYEEWTNSGPSHGEAECLTCHNEHTSKLEFETPTDTCGQCHESHVEEVDNTAHGENDVECSDCHMIIEKADVRTGKEAKTGHDFSPAPKDMDCISCHEVELEKHDALGEGGEACLSCHGDIHELKLELVNGQVYSIDEPVQLCAQCHNERYTAWSEGTHGAHDDPEAVCTECHEPHKPIINQISTLDPIPNRVPAEPSSWWAKMALVVLLEIFGFGVLINWSNKK